MVKIKRDSQDKEFFIINDKSFVCKNCEHTEFRIYGITLDKIVCNSCDKSFSEALQ